MRVTIDGIEVSDITVDELATLIKKFGKPSVSKGKSPSKEPAGEPPQDVKSGGSASHQDAELLKRFVTSGAAGVTVTEISELLGKRGKLIRPAITQWSLRIGLISEESVVPWEITRIGTVRAYRLRDTFLSVAKSIMER